MYKRTTYTKHKIRKLRICVVVFYIQRSDRIDLTIRTTDIFRPKGESKNINSHTRFLVLLYIDFYTIIISDFGLFVGLKFTKFC